MGIESYSTTASNNNSSPPNGAPEGMAPSAVNDTIRQIMADMRSWYQSAEWVNLGYTHVYVASTQFKIAGADVTASYPVGRRVRVVAATPGTIYGSITASTFSTDTTITVSFDSGSLSNEAITSVSVGILNPTNSSQPPFKDSTFRVQDNSDTTKQVAFEVSGVATGTTRTMTVPNVNGTLVTTGDTGSVSTTMIAGDAVTFAKMQNATANSKLLGSGASGSGADYAEITLGTGLTMSSTTLNALAVQRVSTQTGAVATGTTTVPFDDTIPQNTEGDEYMTRSITPTNSSNILVIEVIAHYSHSATAPTTVTGSLFQDSTANALATVPVTIAAALGLHTCRIRHIMTAGTTSSTTFKFRAGCNVAGTTTFNGSSGARIGGGVIASTMMITEYAS